MQINLNTIIPTEERFTKEELLEFKSDLKNIFYIIEKLQ